MTGVMMIESTYRLLSGERPAHDSRAIVPSAHHSSLGQQLRGSYCRFLLTHSFFGYAKGLPVGGNRDGTVIEIVGPRRTWAAYIATLGPADAPDWRETGIPDRGDKGEPGIVISL